MPKLPAVTDKEMIAALKELVFFEHHQKGSHLIMKHPDKRRVVVSIHAGRTIPNGTLLAMLRDAQITKEEFAKVLERK